MIKFTDREKFIIAEFIYSYNSDILIISDAISLIEVLNNHNLISDASSWKIRVNEKDVLVCGELFNICGTKISTEQGTEIMNEYYKKSTL